MQLPQNLDFTNVNIVSAAPSAPANAVVLPNLGATLRYRIWYFSLHHLENVLGPGIGRGGLQWTGAVFALEHEFAIPGNVQVYPPGGIRTATNSSIQCWIVTNLAAGQNMRCSLFYTTEAV